MPPAHSFVAQAARGMGAAVSAYRYGAQCVPCEAFDPWPCSIRC